MPLLIDPVAKDIVLHQWVLPECLHIPTAAVDEAAIRDYVGDIEQVLSDGSPRRAFLVKTAMPPVIDPLLPVCHHPNAGILHAQRQVWVHRSYSRYRAAYRTAFPEEDIAGKVLSHAMNRRIAALKGFDYVRITPNSRGCNSSSVFSEGWGVAKNADPERLANKKLRPPFIQYGDLTDLMLMLDMKVGGGVMAAVNEAQKLLNAGATVAEAMTAGFMLARPPALKAPEDRALFAALTEPL